MGEFFMWFLRQFEYVNEDSEVTVSLLKIKPYILTVVYNYLFMIIQSIFYVKLNNVNVIQISQIYLIFYLWCSLWLPFK